MIDKNRFQEKIAKHYPSEKLVVLDYKGARDTCSIQCQTCGTVYDYSYSGNLLKPSKKILCHTCMDLKQQQGLFEKRLEDRYPDDKLKVEFHGRTESGKIQCEVCGTAYEFSSIGYALSHDRDFFCGKCHVFKQDIMNETLERFKKFIDKHDEWILRSSLDSVHSKTLVECQCNYCGRTNRKTVYDYMRGRGCFCQTDTEQKTTEQFKEYLADDYELLSKYKNAYEKVTLRHSCGFIYKVSPHNYLSGKRCPRCARFESKGERRVKKFLTDSNISFIQEYPTRIQNHLLRFDFYLPQYDLFIEYQGQQHYNKVDFFGGEERFLKQRYLDDIKRDFCGKRLIEIPYTRYGDVESILNKALKFNDYGESQ